MKIGIDCRLWNETGVGRYIRNLILNLQTIDKINHYVLFLNKNLKSQIPTLKSNWKVVETNIHWHSVSEQLRFPQILYKENLDLVHFPYFSHPIFYNRPFVITIHDLIINYFPTGKASTLPYPLYLLKRIGYNAAMSHAIKNSEKIIVPLNSVKEDLIKTYNIDEDKIAVTYEGVSKIKTSANARASADKQNYFLYVGNAYPHKNLEFLIEGFIKFKKEIKDDVKLILVGKEDFFYRRLKKKVETDGLNNINFKHDVSDNELFDLYTDAVAFVSASKIEGFGLPPLEAMSTSCLILLSDIPAFKEVCADVAFYFDPKSINSLKEKMLLVYNLDHKEKQEHIKVGLSRVKDFSWQKMARQTLEIYESCISLRQGK